MTDTDVSDTVTTEQSATLTPDSSGTPVTETPQVSEFSLPDEYKERSWASKIKSQDDVYKQLDNLNGLIGKKIIQPIDYENATPEEISAYHAKLAPEDTSSYDFGEGADPEFSKAVGEVFKELGINQYQAKGLSEKINKIAADMVTAQKAEDTSEAGYFKMMEASFGDKHKEVAAFVERNLRQYASDDDKKIFDSVDNATRTAIDRTIFRVLQAHGVKEGGSQTSGSSQSPSIDINKTRSDIRAELNNLQYRQHTLEEKQALIAKLDATYRR